MNRLLLIVLLLVSLPASADSFYVLVGYVCDTKSDELLITYDGAYNEAGEAMMAKRTATQWDPWQLIVAKDDDHIGSLVTVKRRCQLSDGTYKIEIVPSPGNFNVQGRCGAWMTAGATVSKGKARVYTVDRFENDCHDMDSPIVTRVVIKPKREPAISTTSWAEFYK